MSWVTEAIVTLDDLLESNRRNMLEHMGRSGRGELFVLKYLSGKQTATPSEISDAMQASTGRISAALGALEKKGQIIREIDTANRRSVLVTITEAGSERIRTDMKQMRTLMESVLTQMGERETADFLRLLRLFFDIAKHAEEQLNGIEAAEEH